MRPGRRSQTARFCGQRKPDALPEKSSQSGSEDPSFYREELLFENEKLRRQLRDLIDRLGELESRASSLHYRVVRLSEDNKRLEMGYTGANTQADGLKQLVRDLRQEIQQMKNGAETKTKTATTIGGRGEKHANDN